MASAVQQNIFKVLSCIGCTSISVTRLDQFNLKPDYSKTWKLMIYVLCRVNFLVKCIYLVLLSTGYFEPVTEFFDWIAILLWYLIILIILVSENLFSFKYPFFEILCGLWSYEDSLSFNLSDSGEAFKKELHHLIYSRVLLQSWIAVLGSAAMLFQYLSAPKYCVFTYAAIADESLLTYILFGAHEFLFIFWGWQLYGGVIYISSCLGAELINVISTLTGILRSLSSKTGKNTPSLGKFVKVHGEPCHVRNSLDAVVTITRNSGDRETSTMSSQIEDIILEYRKITILSDRINDYAAYIFILIHGLAYLQMISDVFVMIQLLRLEETDIISIVFFAEDAGVCMYMLFKVFKSMSFVAAASNSYLSELKLQLRSPNLTNVNRVYLTRLEKSLRKVQMKIGPALIGPGMVGAAMMTLMNYYICVALW